MKLFAPNNPSKDWIFRQLAERAASGPFVVCDLACGSGSMWRDFLLDYPAIRYVGSDTDAEAVAKAKKEFADVPNASFEVADAQKPRTDNLSYDVVTTLSALEHVVRIDKFLDTLFAILKPGGKAYLNYDNGHFHSKDLKERVMVPVSQALAKIGMEGPYMKEVRDSDVVRLIQERGARVLQVRKHILAGMKGFTKGYSDGRMPREVIEAWFAFEDRLNELLPAAQLAPMFGSTVIVAQKT
jgi:ubiquinone/menaquinone biosynthesis C-methylase UbiE